MAENAGASESLLPQADLVHLLGETLCHRMIIDMR